MKGYKYLTFFWNSLFDFIMYFYTKLKFKFPRVLTIDQTLDLIIDKKKSFARFGDGEFNLISRKEIGFQEGNPKLAERLLQILTSNSKECLICIPSSLDTLNGFNWRAKIIFSHLISRYYKNYFHLINPDVIYPNSFITRPYIDLVDKSLSDGIFRRFRSIWEQREIIIIEGANTRFGAGNNLLSNASSVKRIITLSRNAFSKYDEIIERAVIIDKKTLILVALGPTATVLAYDLSRLGYQVCDVGHLDIEYEWYLKKVKKKVGIAGKDVNEVSKLGNLDDDDFSHQYNNEIIDKIF